MIAIRSFVISLLFLAAACGGDPGARESASTPDSAAVADSAARADTMQERPDPESPESAVSVVRAYYAAIARGNYGRAYVLWADSGAASGQTFDEFQAGFALTASVDAGIGLPGRIEGAAGSRYISVPIEIRARLANGGEQCFSGSYTLRYSVVPGAMPEQQAWRIQSAELETCDTDAR